MCPKIFHCAWRAIDALVQSVCIHRVPCWRCDQDKRHQEESAVVPSGKCRFVSQDREDIGFAQSDLHWFACMVSTEPECHHLAKGNVGLLPSLLYVLVVH